MFLLIEIRAVFLLHFYGFQCQSLKAERVAVLFCHFLADLIFPPPPPFYYSVAENFRSSYLIMDREVAGTVYKCISSDLIECNVFVAFWWFSMPEWKLKQLLYFTASFPADLIFFLFSGFFFFGFVLFCFFIWLSYCRKFRSFYLIIDTAAARVMLSSPACVCSILMFTYSVWCKGDY